MAEFKLRFKGDNEVTRSQFRLGEMSVLKGVFWYENQKPKEVLIFFPYISIIRTFTGLTFNNPSHRMYFDRCFTQIIVY